MSDDPFARFERSRGSWLIPVTFFILGAISTAFAIRRIDRMDLVGQMINDEDEPVGNALEQNPGPHGGNGVSGQNNE